METEFLIPVDENLLQLTEKLAPQALGCSIKIHTKKNGVPPLDDTTIALIGISENRGSSYNSPQSENLQRQRAELYKLFPGNWNHTITDLGDIPRGNNAHDTWHVLSSLAASLFKENICLITLGGSQYLTYAAYRAFDDIDEMVNLVGIDHRFDFGTSNQVIAEDSYMSRIITEKPVNLLNYSNLGYQTYYNAQEELDLMERLYFEATRLGQLQSDISRAEPILRNANLVSLDMHSVRASATGQALGSLPNGFNETEICALARYAGISNALRLFSISEIFDTELSNKLLAQIIWYFIEGYNLRVEEKAYENNPHFIIYNVLIDQIELQFYKSTLTEKWWIKVPPFKNAHNKIKAPALLPCSRHDYIVACERQIPERWWKAYKKRLN